MKRSILIALALACTALLAIPLTAQAEIVHQATFGGSGTEAGRFTRPAGVAVNNTTGDVYVADYGGNRIEQFKDDGTFIRAWGYDVVASGEDDKPFANEVDEVKIRATDGTFKLSVEGEATAPLDFQASAAEVAAALNALPAINTGGGHVSVSGGPGDPTASNPYVVSFDAGPVTERDINLTLDPSGLALPPATQLTCAVSGFLYGSTGTVFQWLADGEAVAGATSPTFTPGPAEAGKAIQCRVGAQYGGGEILYGVSRSYLIASGTSAEQPPLGPETIFEPESTPGELNVGESNGAALTCNAGSWTHNPETYSYRWYRNGIEIASSGPTSETSNTYHLTQEDTKNKAAFQCAVTGANGGGASTGISIFKASKPAPDAPYMPTVAIRAPQDHSARTVTRTNGGAVFEVCEASPPSDDVCKEGAPGPSLGQLHAPRSIAVDNSPNGDGAVYVHEEENFRVQKFTADGQPILEFGKTVDETAETDVCTAASGDACGSGVSAVDESPVAIGYAGPYWYFDAQKEYRDLGNQLAVDPSGHVYLVEPRREPAELESNVQQFGCPEAACHPRIQKFGPNGEFISMARLPVKEGRSSTIPIGLGVDSQETAYVTIIGGLGQGIERVHANEFGPTGGEVKIIGNHFHPTGEPRQVAVDPRNDRPLFSDINEKENFGTTEQVSVCGGPRSPGRAIIEFDVHMNMIDCSVPLGPGNLPLVNGMAVSSAGKLYAAVGNQNVIKIFKLPVPTAPVVGAQSAKKTTTSTGELHALVDPGFEETSYAVEYGTEDCAVSTCTKVTGAGTVGGLKPTDVSVQISGLDPGTTYHYRFVAQNPLGSDPGQDSTFTTYSLVNRVDDPCPNALARKQTAAAGTLDCRAYELASADWTGGYDVVSNLVPGQQPFEAFPEAVDKVLYGVKDGGIPGTGNPTNRGIDPYVAERGKDGWTTRYVGIPSDNPFATAPFSSTLIGASADLSTFVFGGPQICDRCFSDGSAGVPVRLPNGELVQGVSGSQPDPSADEAGRIAQPLSADGKSLVFGTTSALEPAATDGQATLYERSLASPTAEVISTLPDGATMTGEVGELAISRDGSRVVVGEEVGTDLAGNPLWHPYLHLRGSANSVDLANGPTPKGVYFSGMSANGSTIFMTTADQLSVGQSLKDEDESIDIYQANVDAGGSVTLELVTVNSDGSVSNDDSCVAPGLPKAWNAIEGAGKCNAVPLAGGAGVAAEDGTFFFISPEQLEPGKGIAGQPNLYRVDPQGAPEPQFVALLDNSLEKPGQPPAEHPLLKQKFANAELSVPGELSVDQSDGDLYAVEAGFGEGNIYRYHSDGTPHNFTAGPAAGGNVLSGFTTSLGSWTQTAVDNSPASAGGPLENALYVPDNGGVHIFAPSGESLGMLNGSGTVNGIFGRACGVSVNEATGVVYIADHGPPFSSEPGFIWQYTPNGPAGTIEDSDYTVKGITTQGFPTCSIAADTLGNVYAAQSKEFQTGVGAALRWSAASFTGANPPPTVEGFEFAKEVKAGALYTDPETNELYVDAGKEIRLFDPSGKELSKFGLGSLECTTTFVYNSRGVAVNATTKHVYASCLDSVSTFIGTLREWGNVLPPYTPITSPAVLHGVAHPETHSWGDFQITPDAHYAAFATVAPVKSGYDNGGHSEVYRYDLEQDALLCVSCNPTGSQASSDSVLPPTGLGLLEDGRLFFNSGESLTLEDTNEKLDAYEFSPQRNTVGGCRVAQGCQQLISSGTSAHESGMLGATSDGKDAFFFTRDALVPEDRNGEAMKIYDAREQGGFFVVPPPPLCAASDECHGPGTRAQAPPQIGSYKGTGGQAKPPSGHKCKKGHRRRHGKCVKKRGHRRHHRHKRTGKGGKRR